MKNIDINITMQASEDDMREIMINSNANSINELGEILKETVEEYIGELSLPSYVTVSISDNFIS